MNASLPSHGRVTTLFAVNTCLVSMVYISAMAGHRATFGGVLRACIAPGVPPQVIDGVARGSLAPPPDQHHLACSTCGRLFSRLQNLRQHEAMHDASLQRYKCSHCDATFAWQQTRDRHVVKMHSGGVDRVACPECSRLFLPDSLRVSAWACEGRGGVVILTAYTVFEDLVVRNTQEKYLSPTVESVPTAYPSQFHRIL